MKIEANIEKKHFYFITGLIVLMFGFFVVNASYENGMFHYLSDIVDSNHNSIDSNNDGLVDRVENSSFAETAGSLDTDSIEVNSVTSNTLNIDTICLNGDCRETWPEGAVEEIWLVNSQHMATQCTGAGGEVISDSSENKFCRFNAASCPNGWYQYQDYRTQADNSKTSGYCPNYKGCFWLNSYCYMCDNYVLVKGASWGNIPHHICNGGENCKVGARITQVGCY